MKKVLFMSVLVLYPKLLAAQTFDVRSLAGDTWYGLYLGGHKSGYQVNTLGVDDMGVVTVIEDARFKVAMAGAPQDMRIYSKRTYAEDGSLQTIEAQVDDPRTSTRFLCKIEGDGMVMHTVVGNQAKEARLPKPKETLQDALRQVRLVQGDPKPGDEITYSFFEPFYQKELSATSRIVGIEERVFEGAKTKVYQIKTVTPELALESVSYVTADGTTLEDNIAGKIKMRLEPEAIAKDVSYSNDVIVSNAARIFTPIDNPRQRDSVKLRLKGPLTQDHLFNDERQFIRPNGQDFDFVGHRIDIKSFRPAQLPVVNPDVLQWTQPTTFVQSDHPDIVAKAKEIVGNEVDTLKIAEKLCRWVYDNVHTTYSARLTNALEVLQSLEGDCTEHSILFVALARAAGLPAREVAGLIYMDDTAGTPRGFYFHQWATVWVGKWVDVDPTFNQPQADVTHIKLAEGDLFTQTKLIPIIGQIAVEVPEEKTATAPATSTPQ